MAALTEARIRVVGLIYRKLRSLQALARLLEQLGDVSSLIPDPTQFIPLSIIDLSLYNQLRSNCPALGLPPGDISEIDKLRQRVADAYQKLIDQINCHPHKRLQELDRAFNRALQEHAGFFEEPEWMQCFQFICDASTEKAAQLKIQTDAIMETPTTVKKVLSINQKAKADEAQQVVDRINELANS